MRDMAIVEMLLDVVLARPCTCEGTEQFQNLTYPGIAIEAFKGSLVGG